ncbi:hypothetical protein [Lachnoclostridium edouardi]|uniref:hypothetical protein n=1 Tax=Lachnoclostridium edouardi TaxID=1926283 RepID=UPI000C7A5622|nr:hypothetical protein [Lachnoclostridium edouardi]
MKKRTKISLLTAAMTIAMSMTAFANVGTWHQDEKGWQWLEMWSELSVYPVHGWNWIDDDSDGTAKSYYFDQDGYLLTNTTTSDGYTVNENGEWVVDGVVQTKPTKWMQDCVKPLGSVESRSTEPPVMDGKSIAPITYNDELLGLIHTKNSLDFFTDKQVTGKDTWGPTYTATYQGLPITIASMEMYTDIMGKPIEEANSITYFVGVVSQMFNNFPEQGIEKNAFYDNTNYESPAWDRNAYASSGMTDMIFGLPLSSYRMIDVDFGDYHDAKILLTAGSDGKWYIYPDSKVWFS